ncbi:hypothetical protein A2U01_0053371 [Trifolium medium]|uniref:Uncharacterized protein n=1 Tax=Trifolium medium TaxID=97028 RepID=A0A392R7E2_9FABA|nr:hypothetical protein [Trifolium medium]
MSGDRQPEMVKAIRGAEVVVSDQRLPQWSKVVVIEVVDDSQR